MDKLQITCENGSFPLYKNVRFLVKRHFFRACINVICQEIITGRYMEDIIFDMRILAGSFSS